MFTPAAAIVATTAPHFEPATGWVASDRAVFVAFHLLPLLILLPRVIGQLLAS